MSAEIVDFPARYHSTRLDEPNAPDLKIYYELDGPRWECNCGNQLFRVTPDGIFCPQCGDWANFP